MLEECIMGGNRIVDEVVSVVCQLPLKMMDGNRRETVCTQEIITDVERFHFSKINLIKN